MEKMEAYEFENYIVPINSGDSFRTAMSWYKAACNAAESPIRFTNFMFSSVLTLALAISYLNSKKEFENEEALTNEVRKFLIPTTYSTFVFDLEKYSKELGVSDEFVLLYKEFILINDNDAERGYSMAFMVLHLICDCVV